MEMTPRTTKRFKDPDKVMRTTLETLNKDLACGVCLSLMTNPISLPCCHAYCKLCLDNVFIHNCHCTAVQTFTTLACSFVLAACTL